LLDSNDQAILHAKKVLELNPANAKAHSILIRSAPDTELPEEILQRVPEPYRITPEVANAIGYSLHKKGNISKAGEWLEIAVKNDTADSPELKAELGTILIQAVTDDQSSFFGVQINEAKHAQIERAIQLLTSAWDRVAKTSIRHCRADWITNRGLGRRLLADIDGAIADVSVAVEAIPSDLSYKKYLAMLLHEKSENQKAIGLLEEIVETGGLPEASLLLGEVLREEGKISQGIEIIKKLVAGDCNEPVREEALRLLIRLYVGSRALKSAKEVSSTLLAKNPTKIPYLVDAAVIEGASDKKVEALALLMKAKTYIDATTTTRQILEIADELYEIEEFEEAVLIYERVVDKTLNTPLSRRLMNSYYRAGMLGNALEICRVLHERFGLTGYTVEMESAIYEEIGDLAKAKEACEAYLRKSPGDSRIQLRLAVINLRSFNFDELDRFLDSAIEIKSLSLEHGLQYAGLLAVRNRGQKAFSVAYELRRTFFNNPQAHLKYMGIFLQREKDASDWLNVTKVAVDTAVCIEEDGQGRVWYLIEDREDGDTRRREFNLNHPLVKQMLGKSVGEIVVLVNSPYSKIPGKIIEIKSKYVFAFQESLSSFETLFPDATGMWKVKVGIPRKEGAIPEGFQTVFDDVSKQHERGLLIEKLYQERKLTIGAFSILAGKDIMQVWNRLISSPEPGVIACNGSFEERQLADSFIISQVKLIADLVAIMTLHAIGVSDFMVKRFGKIGIAQSTVDALSKTITELKGIQAKGFMVIGKEGDQFVRQEISVEDIKRNLGYLENILKWIGTSCEILPCKAALTMKRNQRQQLEKTIGLSSIETVLIASEAGSVLYTDDERLRSLARSEFKVNGVWTQVLLMSCLKEGTLDRGKYNDFVIQLASLNYRHTSIDAFVLVEAARRSGWTPKPPFTTILKVLDGQHSNAGSALIVGTTFIYELFKQTMLPQQRDQLILALLDTITSKRNPGIVLTRLKKDIEKKFYLIPLSLTQVSSVIEAWQKLHVT
jgi:tetratricopeptide (TPR) repeat protein